MYFQILTQGGPVMWLIALCSVIAIAVFIERFVHLHRAQINVDDFMKGVRNAVNRGNYREALEACEHVPGPVASTLKAVLLARSKDKQDMQAAVSEAAQLEIPRMEKRVVWLATIAAIAPILGLLGTVFGMMDAFSQIQQIGSSVSVNDLAGGIWRALLTAAAGLSVAIPCHLGYNFIVGRIKSLAYDMERVSLEMINQFAYQPKDVINLEEKIAELKNPESSAASKSKNK
ncbi:MAG: MotA/TolQ/ExbB proton channel family protein [Verrucomicrobiota bacterium]|nr:MotA/TolQ/ExbB proton channel family protein [Verrucomicrobiota bacterium]